jgi:hypothetical protein
MSILEKLKQIVFLPFDRSDRIPEAGDRQIENDDAGASAMGYIPAQFPPNWLKPDDGRPRH